MSKYWRTHVGPYGYEGDKKITKVIMARFHCPNDHAFNACIWKEEVSVATHDQRK